MAKLKSKGTKLQIGTTIGSSVLVDLAQVISIDLPDMEAETYEADTLDNTNAGIPYEPTGRSEGGSLSCELFLDPALEGHIRLTQRLTSPAADNHKIIFANSTSSSWSFVSAGASLGGTVALADGLKATASFKLDGLPTFPTT